MIRFLILAFLIANLDLIGARAATGPIVQTIQGKVMGNPGPVESFKGIPYAAPPIGPLRWQPPKPPIGWSGLRDATHFGHDCMQIPYVIPSGQTTSEDCLTLNIWRPAKPAGHARPVLVYLYGGAFLGGTAAYPLYDGEHLAAEGAVIVSINYRIGIFGFFSHPQLSAQAPDHASGNYGLRDQIAALQWIKANIATFGGDPKHVTVFGESAGAASIALLMTSPMAKDLFQGAILESPLVAILPTLQQAEAAGLARAPDLETLRKMDAEQLLQTSGDYFAPSRPILLSFPVPGPIIDGAVIPMAPRQAFIDGKFDAVPMIVGQSADEGLMFMDPVKSVTRGEFDVWLNQHFDNHAAEMRALYPASTDDQAGEAMKAVIGDTIFGESIRLLARANAAHQKPTFKYVFTQPFGDRQRPPTHSELVPYVMGTLDAPSFIPHGAPNAQDQALSKQVRHMWVQFASSGRPMRPNGPAWPAFNLADEAYLDISTTFPKGTKFRAPQLDAISRWFSDQSE
jgi:para-nitrobenzyl esterase